MLPLIDEKRKALAGVCRRRHVRNLALFGSAVDTSGTAEPEDLDFLVDFEPLSGAGRVEAYFGLQEDLEALFEMPVDLVESNAIRNPYFLEAVEETKQPLYAAA